MLRGKLWKVVMVSVVMALMFSIIMACSKEGNSGVGQSSPPPATQQGADTAQSQETEKQNPVDLSVFTYYIEGLNKGESHPIYDVISEKFNVNIKTITAPQNTWKDKLNVMIASGDMTDIFMSEGIQQMQQFQKWVQEGLIVAISDYAKDYPNIEQQLQKYEFLAASQGGKHYGLPIASLFDTPRETQNLHSVFIRKDWLDKLGLDMPANLDDLYNVAKAFATQDPDGNGKQDTYGVGTNMYWSYPIYNAFGASLDRFAKVDGKWQPEVLSDQMKDFTAYMKSMYDEKTLDPEFMLNKVPEMLEKFVTGKIGIMAYNTTLYNQVYDKLKQAYPEKDPNTIMAMVPVLEGKDGGKRMDGNPNFYGMTSINANIGEEKIRRALELLDYLLSDEGQSLTLWGIEGVHYKKDGDQFVSLLGQDEQGEPITIGDVDEANKLRSLVSWNSDYYPENFQNRDIYLEAIASSMNAAYGNPLFLIQPDAAVIDPSVPTQLSDLAQQAIIKMIIESKNFEDDWDKFKANWLKSNGQAYIDEMNKAAEQAGK